MRKFSLFCFGFIFLFFAFFAGAGVLPVGVVAVSASAASADEPTRTVYVSGKTAGFMLNMGGVQVVAVTDVVTKEGVFSPAADAGIAEGDVIERADDREIKAVDDLNEVLSRGKGNELTLTVRRGEERKTVTVTPRQDDVNQKYKIGILIRDTVSGIGTITYIDKENGKFGALGHGVYDEDGKIFTTNGGRVYECGIISVTKGIRGKAGELKGVFTGDGGIGTSDYINDSGLFGKIDENIDVSGCERAEIAPLSEAHIGDAYIYSTISGFTPQKYEISIVKVDEGNKQNKNFVVKIKDKTLIDQTGGIVQGMSGSPIMQDGKLIGALTHVFLNDPTRGYGIGIEKMLEN
jgi:stage IV sporulation protein B